MNLLGHCALARSRDDDPHFHLGSMLPDLAGMAGLRYGAIPDRRVAAGERFHHETDAAFHTSPAFAGLVARFRSELRHLGLRRGPVLAVSHVGAELLLDGWLAEDSELVESFHRALQLEGVEDRRVVDWGPGAGESWRSHRSRLGDGAWILGYREPARVAGRLERLLGRRPRLRLEDGEATAVRSWMPRARRAVGAVVEPLLADTRSATRAGEAERRLP